MVPPCVRDDKPPALASDYRSYTHTNRTLGNVLHIYRPVPCAFHGI